VSTKPCVTGAAYIARMSDYCRDCRFDPRRTCPITPLYWALLGRHRRALIDIPRIALPLASVARRSAVQRAHDRAAFTRVSAVLQRGEAVSLADARRWRAG
jgi:deoxyribodipyrimidine photolyase-related protein